MMHFQSVASINNDTHTHIDFGCFFSHLPRPRLIVLLYDRMAFPYFFANSQPARGQGVEGGPRGCINRWSICNHRSDGRGAAHICRLSVRAFNYWSDWVEVRRGVARWIKRSIKLEKPAANCQLSSEEVLSELFNQLLATACIPVYSHCNTHYWTASACFHLTSCFKVPLDLDAHNTTHTEPQQEKEKEKGRKEISIDYHWIEDCTWHYHTISEYFSLQVAGRHVLDEVKTDWRQWDDWDKTKSRWSIIKQMKIPLQAAVHYYRTSTYRLRVRQGGGGAQLYICNHLYILTI